ncbi:MAG: adenosylcobinamide-GDP ribazoletransferase [Burkholderiales bacterium]|nr:MAG: adenosylcobinamide-GDP ribazoletransferase [Burkholderiales bacterium]TAG82248.1 MAG: adenosylcobinamide-GDP ribazoletransferase [Betaproteobacteria bacterium]
MKVLIEQARLSLIATQFLTRLPIPRAFDAWLGWTPERLRASARYFPLIGISVGIVAATFFYVATMMFGAMLAAILTFALTALMTGAFHEDGFVDYADSFGATSRERALAIMKDSRIGTFGALAVVFLTAIKALALASLSPKLAVISLILAHGLGRSVACVLMRVLPYVRDESGKAKPLAEKMRPYELAIALSFAAVLLITAASLEISIVRVITVLFALVAFTWWFSLHLKRRLGGFTGDALGAAEQTSEMIVLLVFAAVVPTF